MCRNTVPTLRVLQQWELDEEGEPYPANYKLQIQDKHGEWQNIPVVNRYPEPEQKELPFEDRSSS